MDSKPVKRQRVLLLYSIGEEGLDLYEIFTFTQENDQLTVQVILNKFDEHFKPYINEIYHSF